MLLLLHTPGQIASIFDSGFFIGMTFGAAIGYVAARNVIGKLLKH